MNVLKDHNFFSNLGIEKMKALLAADWPSRKGTNDTTIQDSDPEYNPSNEHGSDLETFQQEVILSWTHFKYLLCKIGSDLLFFLLNFV
jgi:hypothetical protein